MTELLIYNSQGKQVGTEQTTVSTRIEQFFFAGVRLYVEIGREVELTAFFRARESKASRAEQYYAVYRTDDLHRLFQQFTTALRKEIEDTHGMMIQTTSDDVQVFAGLSSEYSAPGSHTEHTHISELLSEGKRLRFGVSDTNEALGLLQKYLDKPAKRVAIAEDATSDELEDCDLVIELGSFEGLEPIGKTEEYLSRKQQRKNASSRRRSTSDWKSTQSEPSVAQRIGVPVAIAVGTFVALLILVFIGINAASVAGIGLPSWLDSLVFF